MPHARWGSTNSGDQGAAPNDGARNKVGREDSTAIRFQIDARRHPRATGPLAAAGGTAGGTRDQGSAEGTRIRAASVVAANAPSPHRAPPVSMGRGPPLWGRSAFNCSLTLERGCGSPPIQALPLPQSPSNSTGRTGGELRE